MIVPLKSLSNRLQPLLLTHSLNCVKHVCCTPGCRRLQRGQSRTLTGPDTQTSSQLDFDVFFFVLFFTVHHWRHSVHCDILCHVGYRRLFYCCCCCFLNKFSTNLFFSLSSYMTAVLHQQRQYYYYYYYYYGSRGHLRRTTNARCARTHTHKHTHTTNTFLSHLFRRFWFTWQQQRRSSS